MEKHEGKGECDDECDEGLVGRKRGGTHGSEGSVQRGGEVVCSGICAEGENEVMRAVGRAELQTGGVESESM